MGEALLRLSVAPQRAAVGLLCEGSIIQEKIQLN